MIKAVIIDDEERSRIVLQYLLTTYCPNVSVVADADSVESGVAVIEEIKPDLLFLDIQLTDGTGFDILKRINHSNTKVIFTTAYDQYALKALKFSAIDYLLKPVNIDELKTALSKVTNSNPVQLQKYQIENLLNNINRPPKDPPILLISNLKSIEFIRIEEIVRCEADGAYCKLFLKDGTSHMVSRVIKELELLLIDYNFFRVHQSHLVNLNELKQFIKSINVLVMRDNARIQLAKSRKENFFNALNKIKL